MKKSKVIILLLVIIVVLICSGCATKMPLPEVREGRFDFSITYEVNGEEITYTGVYVCII